MQRHLNQLGRQINIYREMFVRTNKLLDAVLKDKKRTDREQAVIHKESISFHDWERLNEYFADVSTTLDVNKLTQFLWFHVTLHISFVVRKCR